MLVRQINKMEKVIASMRQSQSNEQTWTPNFGEASTMEGNNISLHASTYVTLKKRN